MKRQCIRVDKKKGEQIRKALMEKGSLDTSVRIVSDGSYIYIPLTATADLKDLSLEDAEVTEHEFKVHEKPATLEAPAPAKSVSAPPAQEKKLRAVKEKPAKEVKEAAEQPSFTDFGLYKCEACGKMVMGFEREKHMREKHEGKHVKWKKLR